MCKTIWNNRGKMINKKAMSMELVLTLVIGFIGLFLIIAWQSGLIDKIWTWFESIFSGIGPG